MNTIKINEADIISKIPCGIIILDEKEKIKYANKQITKLTNLPLNKIIGNNLSIIGFRENFKWTKDSIIRQISYIYDSTNNKIPILINGEKDINSLGKTQFYLTIINMSNVEDWNIKTESQPTTFQNFFHGLVGKSPQMHELYNLIEMAGNSEVNVVIQGESGTGKELVASAIHYSSPRVNRPFVRVNCSSLAETLLESELFGHVKGAFTGAYRDRKGTFETAHTGTIFLDEIGEISPAMQSKLLRVLQEKVITRVGDNKEIAVDVRIIAATNKHLRTLVKKEKFREDLFYRLNVFPIHLPSLAERKTDIPILCEHFLKKYYQATGKNIQAISVKAMQMFMDYCWPGNVRELENTIEHAFVLCQTKEIQVTDLPHELRIKAVREGICAEKDVGITTQQFHPTPINTQKRTGRLNISPEQLKIELKKHNGNKSATALSLGISRVGLWKKLKKAGLL